MGRWKEHLAFNKRERYGVIVLCALLLVVSLLRASWDSFFPPMYPDVEFVAFPETERPSHESFVSDYSRKITRDNKETPKSNSRDLITEMFNPNVISTGQWINLGFSKKQADALVNYRSSIGGFHSIQDVGSSFVISEEKLAQLKPWMVFSKKETKVIPEKAFEVEKALPFVELNVADSLELLTVRGIGPFYAGKIVELRSELGGFSSHQQLLLLYGMDSVKVESISSQTTINLELVEIRNINVLSTKELASHMFIDYNVARTIVKYREQHGNYKSFEDLLNVHLMNDSILTRIRPFFAVHD